MPDQGNSDNPPGDLKAEIAQAYAQTEARQLTPLQAAFLPLTWVAFAAILLCGGFIAAVWHSKLPPVPPLNATPEELAHYRELTDIANDSVKTIVENLFTLVLYPILTLFVGITIGKKIKLEG